MNKKISSFRQPNEHITTALEFVEQYYPKERQAAQNMIDVTLSANMLKILKSMVGHTFCSCTYADFPPNEAYGNVLISLDNFSIELCNRLVVLPYFGTFEDISRFACWIKTGSFKPDCSSPIQVHPVNEKILSVSVIEDRISVNGGEYEITFDMAVVIKTECHSYIFSRGWYFAESMYVNIDKTLDEIYPLEEVIDDWSDDESDNGNDINVIRTEKIL